MNTTEQAPQSLMDYWLAVDAALLKLWGADSKALGIEADEIAAAQESYETPEQFCLWFGDHYELLITSLKDVLSKFESCTGCGGQIEGDHESIERARTILAAFKPKMQEAT